MKSIGETLKKARERRRLTYEVVQKSIKIHPKYIKALEDDNYDVFSGTVHSKGFLKLYPDFLGLDVSEVLALWRREYESSMEKKDVETYVKKTPFQMPKIVVTTASFLFTVVVIITMIFFGYLYYQYRHYGGNPNLQVFYPVDNYVSESGILDVTGKTDLDSKIYINNEEVILNPDGTFVASLKLKEGINAISISSENRLQRRSEVIKTIIYRPKENPLPVQETSETSKVNL